MTKSLVPPGMRAPDTWESGNFPEPKQTGIPVLEGFHIWGQEGASNNNHRMTAWMAFRKWRLPWRNEN